MKDPEALEALDEGAVAKELDGIPVKGRAKGIKRELYKVCERIVFLTDYGRE